MQLYTKLSVVLFTLLSLNLLVNAGYGNIAKVSQLTTRIVPILKSSTVVKQSEAMKLRPLDLTLMSRTRNMTQHQFAQMMEKCQSLHSKCTFAEDCCSLKCLKHQQYCIL